MPNILTTQYYPDDFQIVSYTLYAPVNGIALFYAERDLVIDQVIYGITTAEGGMDATVVKTTTGTLASPANAATLGGATSTLHTAQDMSVGGTYVKTLTTPANNTNLVKAGNWVGLLVTNAGPARFSLQIRYRTRLN